MKAMRMCCAELRRSRRQELVGVEAQQRALLKIKTVNQRVGSCKAPSAKYIGQIKRSAQAKSPLVKRQLDESVQMFHGITSVGGLAKGSGYGLKYSTHPPEWMICLGRLPSAKNRFLSLYCLMLRILIFIFQNIRHQDRNSDEDIYNEELRKYLAQKRRKHEQRNKPLSKQSMLEAY